MIFVNIPTSFTLEKRLQELQYSLGWQIKHFQVDV